MSWEIFVIINLITASLLVPLQRLLLRNEKTEPISFIVVSQLLTGTLLIPFVLVNGFHMPDLSKYGFLVAAMFLLYSLGHYLYAYTLKRAEASIFSTLLGTSTIWVVAMGYLVLHEALNMFDVLGAVIILTSLLMLMERKKRKIHVEKSVAMGLLVGLIFGIASSMWVYIGKHSDLLTWTMISFFGTPLIFLLIRPKLAQTAKHLISGDLLLKMLFLAVIWAVDNLASLAAYQRGNVSIIAPLLQTSAILSVIIAIIFLGERERLRWKIVAAVVCFVGVALIISF
ncbi:DMT family transporter [Candidatus Saccharibacteria bacterium]|nr:MAG: DMT family transporter [Candidatus Saccharibacteria bacterium]